MNFNVLLWTREDLDEEVVVELFVSLWGVVALKSAGVKMNKLGEQGGQPLILPRLRNRHRLDDDPRDHETGPRIILIWSIRTSTAKWRLLGLHTPHAIAYGFLVHVSLHERWAISGQVVPQIKHVSFSCMLEHASNVWNEIHELVALVHGRQRSMHQNGLHCPSVTTRFEIEDDSKANYDR